MIGRLKKKKRKLTTLKEETINSWSTTEKSKSPAADARDQRRPPSPEKLREGIQICHLY